MDVPEPTGWEDFARPGFLQAHVARCFSSAKLGDICVAVAVQQQSSLAVSGLCESANEQSHDSVIALGCLSKLLNAMLTAEAIAAGFFQLATPAAEVLGVAAKDSTLGAITIKDLLEHTHGFDDSDVSFAPTLSSGRIDIACLLRAFQSKPPLAAPGRIYSYSSVGPWIAAAILERTFGRPYGDLLQERLLDPLRIRLRIVEELRPAEGPCVCPALGGALGLTLGDMLQLLTSNLARKASMSLGNSDEVGRLREFPGWSPLERGIRLGWKSYGGEWFGHRSTVKGAAAMARVHEGQATALVVFSQSRPAAAVASALFRTLLPDLWRPKVPALIASDSVDMRPYIGRYQSAAIVVDICLGRDGRPELRVYRRHAGAIEPAPVSIAALRAAENQVFFTSPSETQNFPFVQFVGPRDGRFEFLWNGNRVLVQDRA